MKALGLIELTMAAGLSLMLSMPAWAHDYDHGSSGNSGSSRTYHYTVNGYQNGGSSFGFRTSAGGSIDTHNGYTGANTTISRPHRAAWNAYIRSDAYRKIAQEQLVQGRPDCGFNRSPMDCRVMPYYQTVVTVR